MKNPGETKNARDGGRFEGGMRTKPLRKTNFVIAAVDRHWEPKQPNQNGTG